MKSVEFSICPGFKDKYVEIKDNLSWKPNKVREWPDKVRYDSIDCKLWYDRTAPEFRHCTRNMCWPCNCLIRSIRQSKKRALDRNGDTVPPKCTPLKFMMPEVRLKVLRKRRKETYDMKKKLKNYEISENVNQDKALARTSAVKDTHVTANNKSATTNNKSVTTNKKSATTNNKSVATNNKSVTTNNKSVTTNNKSAKTNHTPVTSKNTVTVAAKNNKDNSFTSVVNNKVVNTTQKKKIRAKKKKTNVPSIAEKNNNDNAAVSVESSNSAEVVTENVDTGSKKRKPEWVGVAVQNDTAITPVEKVGDKNTATAKNKKKPNTKEGKQKSPEHKDTVAVTISRETLKESPKDATFVREINSPVLGNDKTSDIHSVGKNQDIMATSAKKKQEKGTVLAEELSDTTMAVAEADSGYIRAIADVDENKEEIIKVTNDSNYQHGSAIITQIDKYQECNAASAALARGMTSNDNGMVDRDENKEDITTVTDECNGHNREEITTQADKNQYCYAANTAMIIDGNVMSGVDGSKEEITQVTDDINGHNDNDIITQTNKNQDCDSPIIVTINDIMVTDFIERKNLKTENTDGRAFQNVASVEHDDKNLIHHHVPAKKLMDIDFDPRVQCMDATSDLKAEVPSLGLVNNSNVTLADKDQGINAVKALKNMARLTETLNKTKDMCTVTTSAKTIRDRFAVFAQKVKEKGSVFEREKVF